MLLTKPSEYNKHKNKALSLHNKLCSIEKLLHLEYGIAKSAFLDKGKKNLQKFLLILNVEKEASDVNIYASMFWITLFINSFHNVDWISRARD